MGVGYTYTPGGSLAICGSRVAALIDLPPDAGLVAGLYDLIGGGSADLDEVLELLVSPGLRAVEHFALAEYTAEGLRTLVRGRYRAVAGSHTIEGRGLWTDRIVQADGYALVDPATPDEGALPLAGGIVLAGRLRRLPGNLPVEPRVAAPMSSPAEPPVHPASPPRVAAEDAAAAPVAPEPGSGHTLPTPFTSPRTALPDAPSPDDPGPGAPGSPDAGPEVSGPGASGPNIEIRDVADPAGADPIAVSPPVTNAAAPGSGVPSPEFDPPTFIDSLPWSSPASGVGAPPAASAPTAPVPAVAPTTQVPAPRTPVPPVPGDQASERTISRDQLPGAGVQTVVAARCPAGHLSPAYAGTCRVCGQPLPAQQPVEVPRPPLGVLRLSNGDTVVLDRGCILGRNPRVPAGHAGEQPNLVKLIDPDKDISGQHLEVRLEYWHVAVKDLGSTNGTQVVPPGENPVTLRPNDPVMIEPGTRVILAGVFSFTFEVTP